MYRLNEQQQALAEKNLNLVYFVMKKMNISKSRYNYDDIFGAGCIGLCNAALKWKHGGSAFSTFAFYLIKNEILRVLAENKRDSQNLSSFKESDDAAAPLDNEFEKVKAGILFNEFYSYASKNFGETESSVLRLLSSGKNCAQIAELLGISVSAVEKARKKARDEIADWLKDRKC